MYGLALPAFKMYISLRFSHRSYAADGQVAKCATTPPPAFCPGKEEVVNYNLLYEKWIPILLKDGQRDRVGVIDALEQAARIRQIAASNPMDRLAILRFLLALLYRCMGNPPDDKNSFSWFPSEWFKRLDDNKDCFNLLGDGKRFYQCKANGKKLSANYLIQEVPTGTNSWHFRHSTDRRDGLCAGCCAAGLLRLPLFATSGGRGKPPGVNQKPPVYVVPIGVSLAETLRLSWRKVSDTELGTPAWEEPDGTLPKHGNVPLLAGLTWLPRRVWLDNPDEPAADCIACGRREPLIRQCVFAGIGSMKEAGDSEGRVWNDPHTVGEGEGVVKPSSALAAADAAAGKWAEIAAATVRGGTPGSKTRLWVVSFATIQNDKYLEAMEFNIALPDAPAGRNVEETINKIERWQKESWKLVGRATPKEATLGRRHLEIPPIMAAIRPQVEATISAEAGELIPASPGAWEQAAREYTPFMTAIAKSLSPGYTTAALQRRREIEQLRPEMQPRTKSDRKAGRKKGGDV